MSVGRSDGDGEEDPFWSFLYLLLFVLILLLAALTYLFCLPLFGFCYGVMWSNRNPPPPHQMKPYKDISQDDFQSLELQTQQ